MLNLIEQRESELRAGADQFAPFFMVMANTKEVIGLILNSDFQTLRKSREHIYGEDPVEAENSFDTDAKNVYVKHWSGRVMRTSEANARLMCVGEYERISEAEASRFVQARKGRWMDEPAWVRFSANLKRILRAERLHRAAA